MNVADIKSMPFSEYVKLLKQNERFELMKFSGRCFARLEDNFFELLRARGLEHWEHLDHEFEHLTASENTERFWCVSNPEGEAIVVFDGEKLDHYMIYACEATDENVIQLVRLLDEHAEGGVMSDVDLSQIA